MVWPFLPLLYQKYPLESAYYMAKNRRLTISGGGPLITHIRVDSNAKVRIPHKDRVQTLASLILPPKGGGVAEM